MALNGPGVYHRTREHEAEDASNISKNFLAEAWKSWPNEAAVSAFIPTNEIKTYKCSLTISRNIVAPSNSPSKALSLRGPLALSTVLAQAKAA
jgi:hypothetical protein